MPEPQQSIVPAADNRDTFLMKEYEGIRKEMMERLKELWTLEKFALGGAAAISAWLFTHTTEIRSVRIALWLPFIFLALCAERFVTGMYHFANRAALYLIKIDRGYLGEEGGWETWFRKQGLNETLAYLLVWIVALAATFALLFLF